MRKLIPVMTIIILLAYSTTAFSVPSPFGSVEIGFDKEEVEDMPPTYCERDRDCEWTGCGCLNKDADLDPIINCSLRIDIDECICMGNLCIPDFQKLLNRNSGNQIRKYMRTAISRPGCQKFDYLFFNDMTDDVDSLVLAMNGLSKMDEFADKHCKSPIMRETLTYELGGKFIDPCIGFDRLYEACSRYDPSDCSIVATELRAIEEKEQSCTSDGLNCSYIAEAKGLIKKRQQICEETPERFKELCTPNCDKILVAKERCESKEMSKDDFIRSSYRKIKHLCDRKDSYLDKARILSTDKEFALDLLEQEIRIAELGEDKERQGKTVWKIIYKIKKLLRFAEETDSPEFLQEKIEDDGDDILEELQLLSEETIDPALKHLIGEEIKELEKD